MDWIATGGLARMVAGLRGLEDRARGNPWWTWNDRAGAWLGGRLRIGGLLVLFVLAVGLGASVAYSVLAAGERALAAQREVNALSRAVRHEVVAAIDALAVALDAAPAGAVPVFRPVGGRGGVSSRLMLPEGGLLFPRREGGVLDMRIRSLGAEAVLFTTDRLSEESCRHLLTMGLPSSLRGRAFATLRTEPPTPVTFQETAEQAYTACAAGGALSVEVRRSGHGTGVPD